MAPKKKVKVLHGMRLGELSLVEFGDNRGARALLRKDASPVTAFWALVTNPEAFLPEPDAE